MKTINIEIPDEIHTKLKLEAVKDGGYIKDLIVEILTKHSKSQKS